MSTVRIVPLSKRRGQRPSRASKSVSSEPVHAQIGDRRPRHLSPPSSEVPLAGIADGEFVHVAGGGAVVEDLEFARAGVLTVRGPVRDGVLGGLPALVRLVLRPGL